MQCHSTPISIAASFTLPPFLQATGYWPSQPLKLLHPASSFLITSTSFQLQVKVTKGGGQGKSHCLSLNTKCFLLLKTTSCSQMEVHEEHKQNKPFEIMSLLHPHLPTFKNTSRKEVKKVTNLEGISSGDRWLARIPKAIYISWLQ